MPLIVVCDEDNRLSSCMEGSGGGGINDIRYRGSEFG